MKIRYSQLLVLGISFLFAFTSCKSDFEKVRSSGDPALLFEKANEYFEAEEYQKAQTLYELVISSYRGKKEAEEIYYKYAYTYYYLGQYILASYYFKNFTNTFGASPLREEIEFMVAYANYQLSPTFRLDQTYTYKAIDAFQNFANAYPNSERVAESNRLIDEMRSKLERKTKDEGKLYFDLRQYQAAIQSFENLLKDFPETNDADEIRYLIIRSAYLLAENSFVEKQRERYTEAVDRSEEYLERYPGNAYTKEVNDIFNNSKKKLNQINNVRYQNQSSRAGS